MPAVVLASARGAERDWGIVLVDTVNQEFYSNGFKWPEVLQL
jgi:hypothetical protein